MDFGEYLDELADGSKQLKVAGLQRLSQLSHEQRTELYRRWPDLQADLDAVRYVHMSNVAGPSSVPVAAC